MLRMSMRRRFVTRAGAAAIALTTLGLPPARAAASPVRGIFNWIHGTGDAERAFAFYHEVFGIELARSPFAGGAATTTPEPKQHFIHPPRPPGHMDCVCLSGISESRRSERSTVPRWRWRA